MRKIFAVLLCALLLAGCSGESAKENTEPTVNDGLVEVSLLTKCEHWQDDQSQVTISKEYDDQGNVLRETSGTNSYEYQYENGLCISHTSYYDGQLREVSTYEYDDQEKLQMESVFTYDKKGNVTQVEHYVDGQLYSKDVYSYLALRLTPEQAQKLPKQQIIV